MLEERYKVNYLVMQIGVDVLHNNGEISRTRQL